MKWCYYTTGRMQKLRTELERHQQRGAITHYRLILLLVDGEDGGYCKAYVRLHPRHGGPMVRRIKRERTIDRMSGVYE